MPDNSIDLVNALLHGIPLAQILGFGIAYFGAWDPRHPDGSIASRARVGLTVVASLSLISCIVGIILGATNRIPMPSALRRSPIGSRSCC